MELEAVGRWLVVFGAVALGVGLLFLLLSRIGFLGRLPGDLSFERDGVSVLIPLATSLIISVILTIVINVVIRLK